MKSITTPVHSLYTQSVETQRKCTVITINVYNLQNTCIGYEIYLTMDEDCRIVPYKYKFLMKEF